MYGSAETLGWPAPHGAARWGEDEYGWFGSFQGAQ
jgi:hypothetical protein